MNKPNGKIIVFEGLDCSFKETNARALYEHLLSKGIKTHYYSFPRYENESSYFVKEYLKGSYGKNPSDVPYCAASVLYMVDQFHVWKTEMEPNYKDGSIIICDRFWTSNIYHQLSKTNFMEEWSAFNKNRISDLISLATDKMGLPYPDLIFLMKNNFDNIVDLLKQKNSKNDIHESKVDYLKNVFCYYCDEMYFNLESTVDIWCTDYKPGKNIWAKHNLKTKEEIFNDVLKAFMDYTMYSDAANAVKNEIIKSSKIIKYNFTKPDSISFENYSMYLKQIMLKMGYEVMDIELQNDDNSMLSVTLKPVDKNKVK